MMMMTIIHHYQETAPDPELPSVCVPRGGITEKPTHPFPKWCRLCEPVLVQWLDGIKNPVPILSYPTSLQNLMSAGGMT